ncbi:hypothetical protein CYMTET_49314 [Cymbomonas tetramitiformis]|uniref:Guanine nucleotide-binding protein subunit beta-like protein n=1 Tax=Cymbomonas tetramitiformis TaxID=36881 RepID=A0AAE0BSE9_9CHLO|nr:hypothetical protein CYMTET_49314 [Cymbomonas tetramitiformis]
MERSYKAEKTAAEDKLYHLKHSYLKTILKEHHCSPVRHLTFNRIDTDKRNIFATVGGSQASVYDDTHFGEFTAVMSQFTNEKTEYAEGGELTSCCWLSTSGSEEEFGDSLLAVGGKDKCISVISSVKNRVISLLKGHDKAISTIAACAARPDLLLTSSKDGTMRVWDWEQEKCLTVFEANTVTAVAFDLDGTAVITGHSNGSLRLWDLPLKEMPGAKRKRETAYESVAARVSMREASRLLQLAENGHERAVDCLRMLSDGRLITKSVDGRIYIWQYNNTTPLNRIHAMKVPGCPQTTDYFSSFGVTTSGDFLAAGNNSGEVYVFNTTSGTKVANFSPTKVSDTVRACEISDDCRHVLAVFGDGFIWRYEFVDPALVEGTDSQSKEATAPKTEDDE